MERYLRLQAALLLMLFAAFQTALADGPELRWENTRHDFGAFNEDMSRVTCTFRAVNEGPDTLVILNVRANCGCTTTGRYNGRRYAPGDTVSIEATYHAKGRPGRFSKQILVSSNASQPRTTLTVSGTVIAEASTRRNRYPVDCGPIALSSSAALLGEASKGRTASAYVRAYNASADTLRPYVVSHPDYISVVIQPESPAPGEDFIISFNGYTSKQDLWGILTDSAVIAADRSMPDSTAVIATAMTVKEDFSRLTPQQREEAPHARFEPAAADFGRIDTASAPGQLSRKITVSNTGRTPLLIRRIYSSDPAITACGESTEVKPGHSAHITISVSRDAIASREMLNSRVTVITNDPDCPTYNIRAVGEIR